MYELLKDSLKKRKNFLMIIVVVQLLSVILSTLLPYMNGMFVDMLIKVTNIEKIIKYSIMIAGLGILSLCFSYIYNLKIMKIKNNISFEINSRGIFHLQKIPLEIEYEPTYMTQRLSSDSRIVVDFFFDKIVTARAKVFMYMEDYYLLRRGEEIYGIISIVNGKAYINQTSFIGKIVILKELEQQILKEFICNVLINYKKEVKKDSKKIRISFENKGQKMYKELIQSLKELSFVKVAELKDELTIGQDVIIYDYFY